MFLFIYLKCWKQYSSESSFNFLCGRDYSFVMKTCVNYVDNQLQIGNHTFLSWNSYAYFQDVFYWSAFIPHQDPVLCLCHCSLNNFLRFFFPLYPQAKLEMLDFLEWTVPNMIKEEYRFHGLQNNLKWNYTMNFSSLTS